MAKQKRVISGQPPGAAFLGPLANVSLHSKDVVRLPKCAVKGCIIPRSHEDNVCPMHLHFFDWRHSLTGDVIDMSDIYNEDDPTETCLAVLSWQGDCEQLERSLKIELPHRRGWSVTGRRGTFVVYDERPLVPNKQMGRDISRKGWGKKKIRKKQRQRPAGWHGHHPDQKPIKRWSRQTIESVIMPDGSVATIQADGG